MFIIKTRKNSQPQPISYYEIKIQEVKSSPSQKSLISEQNQQNYLKLRLNSTNTISFQNRSKTQVQIKKDKAPLLNTNYNIAYRKIFSQKNLFNLIRGNI